MIEKLGSNHIMKLGLVVRDIEEAAAYYEKTFQLEEPLIIHDQAARKNPHPRTYRKLQGMDVNPAMRWFIVDLTPIYLQVIQPCDDTPSPWLDYLKEQGPGVCFLSFCIDDFEEHIDFMERGGFPVNYIEEKGLERYAYFATQEKLGVMLELKERKALSAPLESR